ncbi:MAG: winged helix-turn-helix domain-containing protein [Muribaculaceae bacterium]
MLWRVTNNSNLEIEDSEEIGKDTTDKTGVAAKVSLKSDLKIIEAIQINPTITIPELEQITGLSRSGVKKILRKLQEAGKVRRVGPDKGGHWEVL